MVVEKEEEPENSDAVVYLCFCLLTSPGNLPSQYAILVIVRTFPHLAHPECMRATLVL